ncbi:MAG: sugar nucleotide-binding protein [Planctomycetales bacterium]
MFPPTTVIGAGGYLGSRFHHELSRQDPNTIGATRRPRDGMRLLDLHAPNLDALQLPDDVGCAIVTAGMTGILACEQHPVEARRVNVEGTLELASQLANKSIVPVLFSTDYVFDGASDAYSDDADACPLNVYGATKAELEQELPRVCGNDYLLLRMSKLYSPTPGDGTLVNEMISRLRGGQELRAATDQVFCPTTVDDVVRIVLQLLRKGCRGLFNLAAAEAFSRYHIAKTAANALGIPEDRITKIRLDDLAEPFERPKRTTLRCDRLNQVLPDAGFTSLSDAVARLTLPGDHSTDAA